MRGRGRSDHGRDQPSPINTSCLAIKVPASSTWTHSPEVVQRAPQSPGALPLLPASGAFPRKNTSPGSIPCWAQGPTQGTPYWCVGAGRLSDRGLPTTARLEQKTQELNWPFAAPTLPPCWVTSSTDCQ